MRRTVTSLLELDVTAPATLALEVAVASRDAVEQLAVTADGRPLEVRELTSAGTRLHVVAAPVGRVRVYYEASLEGRSDPAPVEDVDLLTYLRPSRYCESDSLGPTAYGEFGGLAGHELLSAVSSWVGTRLAYLPGSSLPTDGAVRTLLARKGVCRDYAHLVVGLLRALDVPARLVSVYAPGLDGPDFDPTSASAALAPHATVCWCNGVSVEQIGDSIGAGSTTVECVGRDTRAGTGCGGCRSRISDMLAAHALEAL